MISSNSVEPKQVLYWNAKVLLREVQVCTGRTETSVVLKFMVIIVILMFLLSRTETSVVLKSIQRQNDTVEGIVEPKQVLYWNRSNGKSEWAYFQRRTETSVVLKFARLN